LSGSGDRRPEGGRGGHPSRPLPLVRKRRHRPWQGDGGGEARGADPDGDRAHRRDAGDERARPAPAGRGDGAGRRDPPRPRSGDLPRAAVRAAHGRDALRPPDARPRAGAAQHGLVASLAPKPWPLGGGNGCHVHFSLWEADGSRNRFHDGSRDDRLSDEGRAFLAGALAHLPGLCGLTAPSFNSYHRIVPQYWAGAFTCWGHDNREAPLRVPSVFWGFEEASTNVELKAADASCNPYLAIG